MRNDRSHLWTPFCRPRKAKRRFAAVVHTDFLVELFRKVCVAPEREFGSRFVAMQLNVGERTGMSKECEYRAYAGACVDLANKATNDDDRKHLLAMAEAWLGLIDRAQRPVDEADARSWHPCFGQNLGARPESFQRLRTAR